MSTLPAHARTALHPLSEYIADVPDFPKAGIVFKDISPLLRNRFHDAVQGMAALLSEEEWAQVDAIAGIESRGFILASALAIQQHKGFVKIRKPGKLPGQVIQHRYTLEYGEDALEMQPGSGRLLLVDDVLATGGTFTAAADLTMQSGYRLEGFACLINLAYLNHFAYHGLPLRSLIEYRG